MNRKRLRFNVSSRHHWRSTNQRLVTFRRPPSERPRPLPPPPLLPPPPPPPKVVAKDHARFIESYGTILKAHMDLKKKEKGKARAGGGGAAKAGGGGGGRKVAA